VRHLPTGPGPLKRGAAAATGWLQAALQAAGDREKSPLTWAPADFAAVRWHQLSFAGVARMNRRPAAAPPGRGAPVAARPASPRLGAAGNWPPQARPACSTPGTGPPRRSPAPPSRQARRHRLPARGDPRLGTPRRPGGKPAGPWPSCSPLTSPAGRSPGQPLEPALRPPRPERLPAPPEILSVAGLLDDDRRSAPWTRGPTEKLATLAPGPSPTAPRSWATALRHGTPRSLPRSEGHRPDLPPRRSTRPWNSGSRRYGHLPRKSPPPTSTTAIAGLRGHKAPPGSWSRCGP